MKIYVIKTPEYDINEFKVVKDFFKDFEGPLKFDFENCQILSNFKLKLFEWWVY